MDILDTRDLRKRLEELEDIEEELSVDELEELEELRDMEAEIPEWQYGELLVNEDDFEEYCEEFLKDIGDLPSDIPWYIEIDWKETANNIKADYGEIDYQGRTYLYRA